MGRQPFATTSCAPLSGFALPYCIAIAAAMDGVANSAVRGTPIFTILVYSSRTDRT